MSESAAVAAAPSLDASRLDAPLGPSVDGPARDDGPLPGDPNTVDSFLFLAPDDPRRMMADRQLRPGGVFDLRVLAAFDAVPRERFVAPHLQSVAYTDTPLRCVGGKRDLLSPLILGRMLQAAETKTSDHVLDVAGGSGYSACVLGRIAKTVVALEGEAIETPFDLGDNVTRAIGPVAAGAQAKGPVDVIVVNGAIETAPTSLLAQLAEGGRLVALEKQGAATQIVRYDRVGDDVNRRPVFNASGPILAEFRAPAGFVF